MSKINETQLKEQIEGFTNFDATLTPGAGVKNVMADLGAKSRDLYQVKPEDIYVMPGLNPRVQNKAYLDGVQALADDIKEHGFYQDKPLAGYIAKVDGKNVIALNDGHRRFAATKLAIEQGAPIKTLPIVIKEKSNNMADLTVGLLKSNEGQPFTVYEKAVIAKRLKGYGWENSKIAAEMRCTSAFVGQMLTLAGAPQAIADLVQAGNLSATQAHDLLKEHGNEGAATIATDAVNKAKAAGRTKVTAKDLTPTEKKEKLAKKVAGALFKLLGKVVDDAKIVKVMPDDLYGEIMAVMTDIEAGARKKKAAEPKAPKEPKAKKAPAATKAAPKKSTGKLAKAIATTDAKKTAKDDAKPSGGDEFFNQLAKQDAERKAAKQAAQAKGERRTPAHRERRAA